MAILASLSRLLLTIGASQPLPEGIVNNRLPKNSKVAWSAELAALLDLGICVLSRGDVIERSGKELVLVERSAEFVGKDPFSFGKRKPSAGIEADIPDFMAEVAGDALGFDPLDSQRIRVKGRIDRSRGDMAGGAVAGMIRNVEFVPRSIIGLFRIRRKRNKPGIAQTPIAR
jgi:hypothetical protein